MKKLFVFFLLLTSSVFSQENNKIVEPVKWNFSYQINEKNPQEISLLCLATITENWHIYSQTPTDDGPIPTTIIFQKDSLKFSFVEGVVEPAGEKKMDEAFGAIVVSFSKSVTFTQKIIRKTKLGFKITGSLEFMCCNNMQCLPPKTIPFSIEIPAQ